MSPDLCCIISFLFLFDADLHQDYCCRCKGCLHLGCCVIDDFMWSLWEREGGALECTKDCDVPGKGGHLVCLFRSYITRRMRKADFSEGMDDPRSESPGNRVQLYRDKGKV